MLSTTVNSPTQAVARLKIAGDAPLGFRDLKVTTGAETAALLDGFAITARPAGPTPTPTPSPTPTPPPGGGPPPACTARVSVAKVRVTHRKLSVRGSASCLARVEVAISRAAAHHRCRFVTKLGRLGKPRRCSKPVFVAARGVASWRLATKALPPGRYRIRVRSGPVKTVRIRRA